MRALIDSSVWIDHLRGARTRETALLGTLLARLAPMRGEDASPSAAPCCTATAISIR